MSCWFKISNAGHSAEADKWRGISYLGSQCTPTVSEREESVLSLRSMSIGNALNYGTHRKNAIKQCDSDPCRFSQPTYSVSHSDNLSKISSNTASEAGSSIDKLRRRIN